MAKITSKMVRCPRCGARPGHDCKRERIGSPNSFGGDWGGFLTIQRPHKERVTFAKVRQALAEARQAAEEARQAANEGGER